MILTLVLSVPALASQEVKYKTLKPAGLDFEIEVPGEPTRTLIYVPVGSLALHVQAWDLVKDDIRYQIISFPKGAAGPLRRDANFGMFSETLRTVLTEGPNGATFDRKLASNGLTAMQYLLRVGEFPGVLRIYDSPKNFYAVLAIGAGDTNISVSRYLASFKLDSPRASTPDRFLEAKLETSTPPTPLAKLNFKNIDTVAHGILNNKAVSLPVPKYPAGASGSGRILVRVLVDEGGVVTSAEAVDGPSQFHASATEAAHKARFKPVDFMGRNIKVSGVLVYAFKTGFRP